MGVGIECLGRVYWKLPSTRIQGKKDSRFTTTEFGIGATVTFHHNFGAWIFADTTSCGIGWYGKERELPLCRNCVFSIWLRLAFHCSCYLQFSLGYFLFSFCLVGKKFKTIVNDL